MNIKRLRALPLLLIGLYYLMTLILGDSFSYTLRYPILGLVSIFSIGVFIYLYKQGLIASAKTHMMLTFILISFIIWGLFITKSMGL